MTTAEASAPTRVDLAGGTLDIWPLYLFHPGAVTVNVAIAHRAFCRVELGGSGAVFASEDTGARHETARLSDLTRGPGGPLAAYVLEALGIAAGARVVTRSRVPAGSGLGGSSALAVAIAAAAARALGRALAPDALCALVRDAEARCLGVPTGIQDYLAAIHGGLLAIHLEPGGWRVERLALEAAELERCLVLVDAGVTRFSGINNWEVFKARIDGDAGVREALDAIVAAARGVRGALAEGRLAEVAPLMAREWEARKRLAPGVSSSEIDRIAAAAASAGGAAKVCGAGGGGVVAVWAPPDRREAAVSALRAAGFGPWPYGLARGGLETV